MLEVEAAQRDDDELDGMILDGGDNVDVTNSGPKRWCRRNTRPIPRLILSLMASLPRVQLSLPSDAYSIVNWNIELEVVVKGLETVSQCFGGGGKFN